MDLLKKGNSLIRFGAALVHAPDPGQACVCCTRYDCLPGSFDCQHCVEDPAGPYKTMAECEEQCPAERCAWCLEQDREGPCGEPYTVHECVATGCDEDGECIVPDGVIVSGPIRYVEGEEPDCLYEVCDTPEPPKPPVPECCDNSDCTCCYTCIDGECVYCPEGYYCIDCECRPIDELYYCCQDPPEYGQEPPDPYCQRGPCAPPATQVGGPYPNYTTCCEACGCRFNCVNLYECVPSPTGTYPDLTSCNQACQPPEDLGACCYTIEPYSDDNNWHQPPFDDKCAAIKGCFGMMSRSACEALATDTGTHTVWMPEYDDCSLCPVTWSWVCCFPNPDKPCELLCEETDPNCCETVDGEDYPNIRKCEDKWPSGLDACREGACVWPLPREEWFFEAELRHRVQEYLPPPPLPPPNGDPPCIDAPIYKVGFEERYQGCDWRWVRDMSECSTAVPDAKKICVRWRVFVKIGSVLKDITQEAVFNPQDLQCCACERNNNWIDVCEGDECEPLDFFDDPVTDCLP